MDNFSYQQICHKLDDTLAQEITDFWIQEGAMSDPEAAKTRLPQVMFIARDENQAITAASSVYEQYNEQLKNHFFYLRVLIPQRFRDSDIGQQLVIRNRDFLNADFESGKQTKCIGLMMEVYDADIQQRYPDAIWPESGMVYVGKNAQGAQQRVFYFTDANIA